MSVVGGEALGRIDAALSEWRQGDVARGPGLFFLYVADLARPLTPAAAETAAEDGVVPASVLAPVASAADQGLAVVSQTCDVVRPCSERPFVELAPLVPAVDENDYLMVERGRRPRYAVVPALEGERLVVDLDRCMTVEKTVLAGLSRTPGCRTDDERRAFAGALARKKDRPAFPEDFVAGIRAFQGRLCGKHNKATSEGRALRALREIRVGAAPSWDADPTTLTFWFIRVDDDDTSSEELARWVEEWLGCLQLPVRFRLEDTPERVCRLEDMTARDYVESDRLSLDHLSSR